MLKLINTRHFLSIVIIFLLLTPYNIQAQCTGSGNIVSSGSGSLGNPATLDPDSDGDIVASGTTFTACTGELAEFEALTNSSGCSTCQVPWTPISNDDPQSDLWSGGGCGNTDIVSDVDGNSTYAYFTIIDPDGSCNNGDELIVFRLRISGDFSGNFSFDFLVSNDGLTGLSDPDGFVCCSKVANAGFEYEVQLKTGGSGSGINVIDIDGLAGSDNCAAVPSKCKNYSIATNTQKSNACGSSCGCRTGGGSPIFLTYFVPLTDLDVDCNSYTNLTFVPVTSTSGNPIIANCTSVSDVGGAADLAQALIDCPSCNGVVYSGCTSGVSEEGCILSCTAEANSFSTALPVELLSIEGRATPSFNLVSWQTASEINTSHFSIERSLNGRDNFELLGEVSATGNEFTGAFYTFEDLELNPIAYYRIKFVDLDGQFQYSNTVVVQRTSNQLEIQKIYTRPAAFSMINYSTSNSARNVSFALINQNGQVIYEQHGLPTGDNQNFEIPVSNLPKGLYFISLNDGYNLVSEKLIF